MGVSNHVADCICQNCSCGRHKNLCHPTVHVETHLDSETEYGTNYLKFSSGPRVKGRPQPQQLKVGGEFYGRTENHDQFQKHDIPTVYQHPKAVYAQNPNKLEGITTQKTDYPAWPDAKPLAQRPKATYNGSTGKFESMTTNKHDYANFGPQPVYHHPAQAYVKNEAKFEGISSNKAEYQDWGMYKKPAERVKPGFASSKDDRDFKTTNAGDFVTHAVTAQLVKPTPHQIPRNTSFDGTTTQKQDFQAWPVKPREIRQQKPWTVNPNLMDGHSVYHDSFGTKPMEKMASCAPKYQPLVTGKFEGVSTQFSDYQSYGTVKQREDFKPRSKVEQKSDDRDFLSVMKKDHDNKPLPRCIAEDMILKGVVSKEGHMVLKGVVA